MKGLSFRKTADAIAAFVKEYGADVPRYAVLCTYDLDPTRFEAVVLPELTRRRRWFRTLVIADQAQLQRAGVLTRRSARAAYELAPVRLRGPGVFHAKLIVLCAGQRLLVGIGSANLTRGGLGGHLELMLFASNGRQDGQVVAASAVHFLYQLSQERRVLACPESARRFLERLCVSLPRHENGPIAHSLARPLIQKLTAGRPPHVVRTAVVSPWHSSTASPQGVEPAVLSQLTTALGAPPTVFTEGQGRNAPALATRVFVRILKPSMADASDEFDPDDGDEHASPGPKRPASLHAKAYLAAGRHHATLWFGSANCTTPALLRAASNGGNVELLMRVDLGKADLARIESDLTQMFEEPQGVSTLKPAPRVPAPRGLVLAGYVSSWEAKPRMTLELIEPRLRSSTLRLSRTGRSRDAILLNVSAGETSINLRSAKLDELLAGREAPPVLWEHLGSCAVAFPISTFRTSRRPYRTTA
jgi:hypothetical protein